MAAWYLIPIVAAPVYTLDLGARTEFRGRSNPEADIEQPADAPEPDPRIYDWAIGGSANLLLDYRRTTLSFGYQPSFTMSDLRGEEDAQVLHSGAIAGGWSSRRLDFSIVQAGTIGEQNLSPLATGTVTDDAGAPDIVPDVPSDAPPDQVLANQSVHSWSSSTSIRFGAALTRRLRLSLATAYDSSGGLDEESKEYIPPSFGVSATGSLGYGLTRRDTIDGTMVWSRVRTRPVDTADDVDTTIVTTTVGWSRAWDDRTSSDVSIGFSYVPPNEQEEEANINSVGSASLTRIEPLGSRRALEYSLSVSQGTTIDRLTGQADQRIGGAVSVTWINDPVEVFGDADLSRSVDSTQPDYISSFSAATGVRVQVFDPYLQLEAGMRFVNSEVGNPSTPLLLGSDTGFEWASYVAATAVTDSFRF